MGIRPWDSVDRKTAQAILSELRSCKIVALSLSTDETRISKTVEEIQPRVLHLARATGVLSPSAITRLRRELRPIEIMITIPVRGVEAVDTARRYPRCSDYLLLDSVEESTGIVGATGLVHDWSISASIVRAVNVPVILAGGLGPDTVLKVVEIVQPAGLDSETRTSSDLDRRLKDQKLLRFVVRCDHPTTRSQRKRRTDHGFSITTFIGGESPCRVKSNPERNLGVFQRQATPLSDALGL